MIAKSAYQTRFIGWALPLVVLVAAQGVLQGQSPSADTIDRAFTAACDGYSSDELVIQDQLRDRFLEEIFGQDVAVDADQQRAALLHLLKLRKAGKLTTKATRRGDPVDETVVPVAEIAARVVTDRHQITTDTMLCDPDRRAELQREAELIAAGVDGYAVRKAVLSLRKRRALRPELVLKVADWAKEIKTLSLDELRHALEKNEIPSLPGVYLFRSPTGYLYVGEAKNLAQRLAEHTSGSDRASLAQYLDTQRPQATTVELHIFPADSPAARVSVRRAYESELIRSRQPRFNVRP